MFKICLKFGRWLHNSQNRCWTASSPGRLHFPVTTHFSKGPHGWNSLTLRLMETPAWNRKCVWRRESVIARCHASLKCQGTTYSSTKCFRTKDKNFCHAKLKNNVSIWPREKYFQISILLLTALGHETHLFVFPLPYQTQQFSLST